MTQVARPKISREYFYPRNWPAWLLIACLFSLSLLPQRLQQPIGRALGKLAQLILKSREKIARRNLELCFPKQSEFERERLIRHTFAQLGHSVLDTANAWFWSVERFNNNFYVEGIEHLNALRKPGMDGGIVVVSAHFYSVETHARCFGYVHPGVGIYRPNTNLVYEYFQHKARTRHNKYLVERKDVRGIVRCLRQGEAIWYAPDHDYGRTAAVFAPFFAQEKTATITGTASLAKVKGVRLLLSYMLRQDDGSFKMVIEPIDPDFPSREDVADAAYINARIAEAIMHAPEQYMWIHRRFKTRPEGEASLY